MLRPHRWSLGAALFGIALLPGPARPTRAGRAAQGEWVHLGARQVDFRVDHDVIRAAGEGRFRRIRIDVDGGDMELFNVRVTFGDGESFSPPTRLYFREHSRTRVIDLPGAARIIRRIDFSYRSVPGGGQGKTTVHVYGRR